MTTLIPPDERELSLPEAYARVLQELNCLGLACSVRTLGERIVNTRVMLSDANSGHQGPVPEKATLTAPW